MQLTGAGEGPAAQALRRLAALLLMLGWLSASLSGHGQAGPAWEWAQQEGSTSNDVALDASGNAYVVGGFAGSVSFGSSALVSRGSSDISLAKYDSQGRLLWVRQAGGPAADAGNAVAVDASGNVYITGGFTSATAQFGTLVLAKSGYVGSHADLFVAKYSAQGTALWARSFSGPASGEAAGTGLAVDAQGNAYATGGFQVSLSLDNRQQIAAPLGGYLSAFLLKFDPLGTVLWARSAGHTGALLANSGYVGVAPGGAVYFAGATVEGPTYVNNATAPVHTFLKCLDANGLEQWTRTFGTGTTLPTGVAVDALGNAAVAGSFQDDLAIDTTRLRASPFASNAFVLSFDPRGTARWGAQFGAASVADVAADGRGGLYVVGGRGADATMGAYASPLPTGVVTELYVAKIAPQGQLAWVRPGGGSGTSNANAVAADALGNAYVAGWGLGPGHCGAAPGGLPGLALAKLRPEAAGPPASSADARLDIYPNPAAGSSFDVAFAGMPDGPGILQLFSAQGRLVRSQAVRLSHELLQTPFDRSSLPPGRYTLRLVRGQAVRTVAVLLQ